MTYYVFGALEDSCMVDSYAMVWKRVQIKLAKIGFDENEITVLCDYMARSIEGLCSHEPFDLNLHASEVCITKALVLDQMASDLRFQLLHLADGAGSVMLDARVSHISPL
jgi:hypothetical protein